MNPLPRRRTSLIGRDAAVTGLSDFLVGSQSSLVTLAGPGGVGKTRLALEVAHILQPAFRDGVRLIDLQTISEPHLVVTVIAAAFGIDDQGPDSLLDSLSAFLRSRRLLLVLDNCEHIIGACAQVADHLLGTCIDVRILATSREPLRTPGEQIWPVPPLPTPAQGDDGLAAHAIRNDSVRLFVQRAQAAAPAFDLNNENAGAVSEICRQLDGVPLAIELAASRVASLSPEQIAHRLGDRFQLLASAHRVTSERHRSLRHVIEWSYGLLNRSEQALLNRLAVFSGDCSLEAIEAICSDGVDGCETLNILSQLIEKSLVLIDDYSGTRRYRLSETLRMFARERLVSSGEVEAVQHRHTEYYLRLAETAEPGLWTSDVAIWLDVLDKDHDNMRAALRRSVGQGDAEIGQRLGAALYRFWMLRGYLTEGMHWLEGSLAWSSGTAVATRARALNAAGHLARAQGLFERARSRYEESLALHRQMSENRGTALTLNNLGVVAQFENDYARAVELHEESLRLFRAAGDPGGIAVALVTLGTMAQLRGDFEHAFDLCDESVSLFRQLGDRHGVASALNNLGNVARAYGRADFGANCYREALALFRELGDHRELAACLRNLATAARDDGDQKHALTLARESLALSSEQGDSTGVLACLALLANILAEDGRDHIAVRLLGVIETVRQDLDGPPEPANGSDQDSLIAGLRDRLGSAEFAAAWAAGTATQLADAIRLAGAEQEPVALVGGATAELSTRQMEVVGLIVQGLSNKRIAEALFISERTVDTHVEHILRKLGLHSRTQVVAWEMERRSRPE